MVVIHDHQTPIWLSHTYMIIMYTDTFNNHHTMHDTRDTFALQLRWRCQYTNLWNSAVCCSVLQCVAACCIVLQCVAVCCSIQISGTLCESMVYGVFQSLYMNLYMNLYVWISIWISIRMSIWISGSISFSYTEFASPRHVEFVLLHMSA